MKRIDTANATTDNHFQEGNPLTGLAPTVVSGEWLNVMQEEICNAIIGSGQTLDQTHTFGDLTNPNNTAQLLAAIRNLAAGGPVVAPLKVNILNNQSAQQNIVGLLLDNAKIDTARFIVSVYVKSDSIELQASGELWISWKPIAAAWQLTFEPRGDLDHGILFFIDNTSGQVSYKSSNIAGTNYVGTLRVGLASLIQA